MVDNCYCHYNISKLLMFAYISLRTKGYASFGVADIHVGMILVNKYRFLFKIDACKN